MKNVKRVPRLPLRARDGHKGDYGRVLVLAGSRGMVGAAALAGQAALRSGAGLVTIGAPAEVYPILAAKVTCCMTCPLPGTRSGTLSDRGRSEIEKRAESCDVIALGPGLGRAPSTTRLVLWLARHANKPMVMDADALNALSENTGVLNKARAPRIVTPHPGEMARLLGLKSATEVQATRKEMSAGFARKSGAIVVLKGHHTVVTDGERIYMNPTGNPGMATGGTGDVLTGAIAGLLAQGMDPFDAAQLGVHVHGLAGDLAAKKLGEISLIAGDVLDHLPEAFKALAPKQ